MRKLNSRAHKKCSHVTYYVNLLNFMFNFIYNMVVNYPPPPTVSTGVKFSCTKYVIRTSVDIKIATAAVLV